MPRRRRWHRSGSRRGALAAAAAVGRALSWVAAISPGAGIAHAVAGQPKGTGKPDTGALSSTLAELAGPSPGKSGAAQSHLADNHPGGLRRLDDGRVLVDVRVDDVGQAAQRRLTAAGGEVVAVSHTELHTITVSVADTDVLALSRVAACRT